MKIYIAGASAEIDVIEKFMGRLRAVGHEITHDWTKDVRAAGSASPNDSFIRLSAAEKDRHGVIVSQVTWIVQPSDASSSTGAWVELGIALGLQKVREAAPMIVVSGSSQKCIFSDLADSRFDSHEDALAFIEKLPKGI